MRGKSSPLIKLKGIGQVVIFQTKYLPFKAMYIYFSQNEFLFQLGFSQWLGKKQVVIKITMYIICKTHHTQSDIH